MSLSKPNNNSVDPTVAFFYQPRTISLLILTLSVLIYIAFFVVGDDSNLNTKIGILMSIFIFLLIGLIQFRDGPFIRPHPAVWRIVLGLSVVYELLLVFTLFQNKAHMRELMADIDPSLGFKLPEKSYAENCDFTPSNVWSQIDEFVLAHALGWWGKTVVLRDYWFCWTLSIMFELMEYSLQHQLPNFAECWWDHWLLDVLFMNWLGIYLGMKTCEFFNVRQYSWRGIKEIPTVRGKVKRSLQQFTPHSWSSYSWESTKTFKNFISMILVLALILQLELNVFYLKYLLWIPSAHWMVTLRLALVFMMALPATRETYSYMHDSTTKRFGMHAWLMTCIIMTELLICIKFGKDEFKEETPRHVWMFWSCVLCVLCGFSAWKFWWCARKPNNNTITHIVEVGNETESDFSDDNVATRRRSVRIRNSHKDT